MSCRLSRLLTRSLLLLAPLLAMATPAQAAEKPWSVEYESSLNATTNVEQTAGGNPDWVLRNSLEFSYYPTSDSENSALFRIQALNQRYYFNPDFNSTFLIATALASRRLIDSMFGYGGYQFLYKQADAGTDVARKDNDLFGGLVVYHPLSNTRLIFHGYQFDYLRADVQPTSYLGHSLYVTFRDLTTDRWSNEVSLRSQLRFFDTISEMEWRNFASATTNYRLLDWWSLEGEVIYMTSAASRKDFSFNGWDFSLYTRFYY